jgi:hypothetical protein
MTGSSAAAPLSATTRRSKIWLVITSLVFTVWIAGLIAMYFKTVYPQRHPANPPQTIPTVKN